VRNRHVRLPLPDVEVRFAGQFGRLMNLSLSGGQLLLDYAPVVDSVTTLRLEAGRNTLELRARVVRVIPAKRTGSPDAPAPRWTVSVAFVEVSSEAHHAIPRFYSLLLGSNRRLDRSV
jgi:hypothetical protein